MLIVEKRPHIAGNCYDEAHSSGVWIHRYGPHYFRTNSRELLAFLSAYTEWIPGNYRVQSFSGGRYFPFPINLTTLERFFGREFTEESARAFLATLAVPCERPRNSEDFVLSRVGRELYEAFYKGYTLKQWGRPPAELDPSVCGRIPIRFNRDDRYVDQEFQVTPKEGFTALFRRMVDHPAIEVRLSTDFFETARSVHPRRATVYTGAADEYFGRRFGALPWRSLQFEFREFGVPYWQPCVQVNYPNDFDYTRTTELKHVTQQQCANTVIAYEYSRADGDPYYPIPAAANEALYQQYRTLALEEQRRHKVYFVGRLATYRYYNTDQVIEEALKTFAQMKEECGGCRVFSS